MRRKRRSGMVTTEMGIGIALTVVAVIFAIGLFNDNLSNLAKNSNLNNATVKNDSKTFYKNFNKDYSNSQINVQIMGAQGLSMLRRKANNKALDIIKENSNSTTKNADTIAYLTTVIKALTGETDLCGEMKINSDKHCDEIGGYSYNIDIATSAITIERADTAGNGTGEVSSFAINNQVGSIITSKTVPVDNQNYSTFTTPQKYKFIKELSEELANLIRPDALLINVVKKFKSTDLDQVSAAPAKTAFLNFVTQIEASSKAAYEGCKDNDDAVYGLSEVGCGGYGRISKKEYAVISAWYTSLTNQLNALCATENASKFEPFIKTSLADGTIIDILNDDNYNVPKGNKSSCQVLTDELNNINTTYKAGITVPTCTPTGPVGTGLKAQFNDAVDKIIKEKVPVISTVVEVTKTIVNAGASVVNGVINGAKNAGNAVGKFLKGLFGK